MYIAKKGDKKEAETSICSSDKSQPVIVDSLMRLIIHVSIKQFPTLLQHCGTGFFLSLLCFGVVFFGSN